MIPVRRKASKASQSKAPRSAKMKLNFYRKPRPKDLGDGKFSCPYAPEHCVARAHIRSTKKAITAHLRKIHLPKFPLSFDPVMEDDGTWICPIGGRDCGHAQIGSARFNMHDTPRPHGSYAEVSDHVRICHPVCPMVAPPTTDTDLMWACPMSVRRDGGLICGDQSQSAEAADIVRHIRICHARPMRLHAVQGVLSTLPTSIIPEHLRGLLHCPFAVTDSAVAGSALCDGIEPKDVDSHISNYHGHGRYHPRPPEGIASYIKKHGRKPVNLTPVRVLGELFACPWSIFIRPDGSLESEYDGTPLSDSDYCCFSQVDKGIKLYEKVLDRNLYGGSRTALQGVKWMLVEKLFEYLGPYEEHPRIIMSSDGKREFGFILRGAREYDTVTTGLLDKQSMMVHIRLFHAEDIDGFQEEVEGTLAGDTFDEEDAAGPFIVECKRDIEDDLVEAYDSPSIKDIKFDEELVGCLNGVCAREPLDIYSASGSP